jgi:hypothetical protein
LAQDAKKVARGWQEGGEESLKKGGKKLQKKGGDEEDTKLFLGPLSH